MQKHLLSHLEDISAGDSQCVGVGCHMVWFSRCLGRGAVCFKGFPSQLEARECKGPVLWSASNQMGCTKSPTKSQPASCTFGAPTNFEDLKNSNLMGLMQFIDGWLSNNSLHMMLWMTHPALFLIHNWACCPELVLVLPPCFQLNRRRR